MRAIKFLLQDARDLWGRMTTIPRILIILSAVFVPAFITLLSFASAGILETDWLIFAAMFAAVILTGWTIIFYMDGNEEIAAVPVAGLIILFIYVLILVIKF